MVKSITMLCRWERKGSGIGAGFPRVYCACSPVV